MTGFCEPTVDDMILRLSLRYLTVPVEEIRHLSSLRAWSRISGGGGGDGSLVMVG